jgi:subtilisin-like proprotein convertase family protein
MACGAQASLTLHVTSDQGSADLPVALTTGSGSTTFASSDVPKTIEDGRPASTTAVSTLTIPSGGRVEHVRVTAGVTHTFIGDLHAYLTSPAGTTVALLERPGLGDFGSDLAWGGDATFDDDAPDAVQEIPFAAFAGDTLPAGAYAPDELLARFAGEDRAGTWTLRLVDVIRPDGGTLDDWSLETDEPACTLLPPPSGGGGGTGGGGSSVASVAAPTHLTAKATLAAGNAFAFAFRATPGLSGSVTFTIPKHGKTKAIAFGRHAFGVGRDGRVRLKVKLSRRALAQLRKRHKLSVNVTIALGGRTFRAKLTLTGPRPRHRRG